MIQPSVVCLNSVRSTGIEIVGVGSADVRRCSREDRQRRVSLLVQIIRVNVVFMQ